MAGKTSSSDARLVCEDPKSLVKKCMGVVGRRLERSGKISFKQILHARGEREFLLLSPQSSSARARQDYPVLYFEALGSKTYWLAVSLRFTPWLDLFRLIQASLLLFEGALSDPEKSPILRAEWDDLEEGVSHAQPHWHVYPAGAGAVSRPSADWFPVALSEPIDFAPQAAPREAPGEPRAQDRPRFHYAMAARWHLEEGGSYRCSLSEGGLITWLSGCIDYVRGQLPHIARPRV